MLLLLATATSRIGSAVNAVCHLPSAILQSAAIAATRPATNAAGERHSSTPADADAARSPL